MKNSEIYLDIFNETAMTSENYVCIEEELGENSEDIAIVGMAVKVGSCQDNEEFWEALSRGEELIRDFPSWRADDIRPFCNQLSRKCEKFGRECFLEHIDLFSPEFFHMLPKDAALIDPAQRMFLMTAWSALEDACLSAKKIDGTDTGVYVGYTSPTENYSEILAQSDPEYADRAIPGKVNSIIASRLSYWLNLKGPAVMVDTACSSSLAAVHAACSAIHQGDCKQAIVGSVKINLMPLVSSGENSVSVISTDGSTRTFDVKANGTNPGEGVAALVLKPLNEAEKDKDRIYAVIKGSALNQDGTSVGITAPNADAQEEVIVKAWENARINPEQVSYIEAHGTATKLGDPVELTAMDRAFHRYTDKKQFCAVGSVKANLGHLDCASGIFGLIKCVLELRHKTLLPQINFASPNKEIDFISSAVYVNEQEAYWNSDGPRICGVSSFGMSGTNCHVVLQEYENDRETYECLPMVLPLSARNEEELIETAELFSSWVKKEGISLSDCIYSASISRSDYDVRAAVIVKSMDDIENLSEQVQNICSKTGTIASKELDEEAKLIVRKVVYDNNDNYEDFQELCRLYHAGANVDWQSLYETFPVTKTSLPSYPMKLQRCWEMPENHNKQDTQYEYTENEQLIDTCLISSPQLNVYKTIMSESTHTEVREHIIGDKNVLAGTVYVEMLRCAAKKVLKNDKMQVDNLLFMNAMIFEKGQTREVQTILYLRTDDKYDVTIQSRPVGEETWEIHAQGQVSVLAEENPESVDIEKMLRSMAQRPLENETSPVEQLVTTGPRWQVNRGLWVGNEEAVTMAEIDSKFTDELKKYYLYPSMLDAAVNCSSALNGNNFCLPYYYGTLKIYDKIPKKIYSHTIRNAAASSSDGELNVFDISIVDEFGRVIAIVKNYAMKKAGASQKKQFYQKEVPWMHTLNWVKETTDFKAARPENDEKAVIVVRTIDNCNERLLEEIRDTFRGNIYELILCEWEMRDTARKYYSAPGDLNRICTYFEAFDETEIARVIFMVQEHRSVYTIEKLDDAVENMLHAYYNIIYVLAFNKKLGNPRVDLIIKTTGPEIDPMALALQGMGKSLLNEYSRLKMGCIVYTSETELKHVINELFYSHNDYLILLKNGERFVMGMKEVSIEHEPSSEKKFELTKGGTYIITGGLGGIGLVLAEYFAELESNIRLVLMSRRELLPQEEWEKETDVLYKRLCELNSKVSELIYCSCDVSDEKSVEKHVESLGCVTGIVHAAGVAGGGFIIKKDWDDYLKVLKPKMHGTLNMLNLSRKYKPEFIVLFSSYSTILPVAGQSDYISANSFIDAMVVQKDSELPVKVINWSGWKECGMAYDNGGEMIRTPVTFLSNAEGVELFAKAMVLEERQVLIGKINCEVLEEVADDYSKVIRFPDYVTEKIKNGHGNVKNQREIYHVTITGKDAPLTETETKVSQAWAKVLGLKEIHYQDKFLEIGGDSLSATYLQKELNNSYPQAMDITDVFVYSSIKEMADFIDSKIQQERKEESMEQRHLNEDKGKSTTSFAKNAKGDLNELLQMLADGKIDVKEAGKYI